jgi:lysyl-tRNA synthetase class II
MSPDFLAIFHRWQGGPHRSAARRAVETYIYGWEIANAFSELNDPQDQRALLRQCRLAGDEEAQPITKIT